MKITEKEQKYLLYLKQFGGKVDWSTMYRKVFVPIGNAKAQKRIAASLVRKKLITVKKEMSITQGPPTKYITLS